MTRPCSFVLVAAMLAAAARTSFAVCEDGDTFDRDNGAKCEEVQQQRTARSGKPGPGIATNAGHVVVRPMHSRCLGRGLVTVQLHTLCFCVCVRARQWVCVLEDDVRSTRLTLCAHCWRVVPHRSQRAIASKTWWATTPLRQLHGHAVTRRPPAP